MLAPSRKAPTHHPFYWLATLVLVVLILSRAQAVVAPLILSVLIAFALTPAVRLFERRIGHGLAVALVVVCAVGAVMSFGYLIERQLVELSTQMKRYSTSIESKMTALRGNGEGGLSGLSKTVDKLAEELDKSPEEEKTPRPVQLVPAQAGALERFNDTVAPILKPIADFVVVLVLVIFLLSRRGDLRDRFIRLAGKRNISVTTRTMDEAGHRIGRYLITQSAINGGFGVAIALALWLIGVPFPPLWGFLAAALRFVPFIGTLLGMLLPAALAFAELPGWSHTLAVLALFMGLDSIVAYAVEPMVVGHKTGVSSLAMIIMAVFWTWLWGPVGLVLSTPLTVCLAVLGRQVPRLEFLAVLLGDDPALDPEVMFYQRLLAGDDDEATNLFEKRAANEPRERTFDALLVPALHLAQRDRARGEVTDGEHEHVLASMRALVTEASPAAAPSVGAAAPLRIFGVAGRNVADQLAWEMLVQVLNPALVAVAAASPEALMSEVVETIGSEHPDLVVVTSVAPDGAGHARHLCKRLQLAHPGLRILILRLEAPGYGGEDVPVPAADVARTIDEARTRIEQALLLAPALAPAGVALTAAPPVPAQTIAARG